MSPIEPDFASRLTARMGELDITVPALIARCGGAFSVRTIFRWRAGESAPGIEALPLLARALETSCDWLLGYEPTTREDA